jgi:outer membrane protein TolC
MVLPATMMLSVAQTNTPDYSGSGSETNATGPSSLTQTNASGYVLPDYSAESMPPVNASATVRELSLQECIQLALQTNLDLQIERYNPQIAHFTLSGAYAGYDPLLSLSGQHDRTETGASFSSNNGLVLGSATEDNQGNGSLTGLLPWGMNYTLLSSGIQTFGSINGLTNSSSFQNANARVAVQLSQPLLKNFWIDNTRLNIRVAKNRLKYAEQGLRLQIMQTVTAVEQAYYDLIYNRQNLTVQQKAVELADRLVLEDEKKLEVGSLAPLDLASARAQAAQSRAAVIAAMSQLGTQERRLKALLTYEFSVWAEVTLVPSGTLTATRPLLDRQESWRKGLAQRPELLQAKLDVERQGILLKYDQNQLYPQLDVFGTYGYNGAGIDYFNGAAPELTHGNLPFYTAGARLVIPLSRTSARNVYKSDKAALQQIVLTLKKQEQSIMITLDNDIGTIRADYDQVMATRAQRQYEEQALDAEQKKLENGKSTTYTVLQVQRDLTAARGAEILALDNFNKDLAQLSLDEGTTLQRLGIDIESK